jgi:hypothetical protein
MLRIVATTALEAIGAALIIWGIALIFVPAALIAAGVGVIYAGYRLS